MIYINKKLTKNCLIALIVSVVFGYFLMVLSCLIPYSFIEYNLNKDLPILNYEEKIFKFLGQDNLLMDNFTDSLMLSETCAVDILEPSDKIKEFSDENLDINNCFVNAAANYYLFYSEASEDIIDVPIYNHEYFGDSNCFASYYFRYWHGYLTILKPLLIICSISRIRLLFILLLFILLLTTIILMVKRRLYRYLPCYFLGCCSIGLPFAGRCFEFFFVLFLALLFCIIVLLYGGKTKFRNHICFMFFINGIIVNYFDFFTAPLLCLGFPLVMYLIVYDNNHKLGDMLKLIFSVALFWLLGYALMWISKWIIALSFLGPGVIENLFDTIIVRSGDSISAIDRVSYFDVLQENFRFLSSQQVLIYLYLLFMIFVIIFNYIKYRKNLCKFNVFSLSYLVVSLLPFVWFFFIKNHTFVHAYFTYRMLGFFVFALSCFCVSFLSKRSILK